MAGKVIKSGTMTPVRGGSTKMFGKQHAGPQKPGGSAHNPKGTGGKYAKGGPSGKVGKQGTSRKAIPGQTSLPAWGGRK